MNKRMRNTAKANKILAIRNLKRLDETNKYFADKILGNASLSHLLNSDELAELNKMIKGE